MWDRRDNGRKNNVIFHVTNVFGFPTFILVCDSKISGVSTYQLVTH